MRLVPTASQTAGPFFRFGLDHPAWSDLTGGGKALGQKIEISGCIIEGDGHAVPDALVELWQANAAGRYAHPDDRQGRALDDNFRGFGRSCTDKDGVYRFLTIRPGAVPGRGNALQSPHLSLCVFARGLLKHVTTRMYFPDEPLNKTDPVLNLIDNSARQKTLIGKPGEDRDGIRTYRFDIVLQGKNETVFFDI